MYIKRLEQPNVVEFKYCIDCMWCRCPNMTEAGYKSHQYIILLYYISYIIIYHTIWNGIPFHTYISIICHILNYRISYMCHLVNHINVSQLIRYIYMFWIRYHTLYILLQIIWRLLLYPVIYCMILISYIIPKVT